MITYFTQNPKALFLLDGLGAILTASSAFFVLKLNFALFGVPDDVTFCASAIALIFSVYSLTCFLRLQKSWQQYLRIIASCNILYCIFILLSLFTKAESITQLGCIYFIVEIPIILGVALVEFKVAHALTVKKTNEHELN